MLAPTLRMQRAVSVSTASKSAWSVKFIWTKGHAGHPENERCDVLAVAASRGSDLKEDNV